MQRVLLTAGFCLILSTMASSYRLVCYYSKDAATRPSIGMMTPGDIDPNLCTHIIFGFAFIDNHNNLVPAESTDTTLYTELNSLKTSNPQLKTMLAVGGPEMDNQKFSTMVASANSRATFISSVVAVLTQYNFDGLNLDWRYPGGAGSQPQDKTRFTKLCEELRTAFNTKTPALILSASVAAEQTLIDNSYEVPNIAAQLDFLNVLTFNFHAATEPVTAHHSPLNPSSSNPTDTKTTKSALSYWKTQGAPAAKLNMGIAAYGVAFTLTNPTTDSGVGAAASGPGELGCYGVLPGVWSYYETCLYTEEGQFYWLSDQKVPYAVTAGQWVGYDNAASLDAKFEHIIVNGYGGACVWALDLDDFTGQFCQQGNNPFIRHLHDLLNICNGQSGVHPNPADNKTFYNCDHGVANLQPCPAGLVFKTSCSCCTTP